MRRSALPAVLLVVAAVFLVLAVYYLIPGVYHPLTFSPPYESHKTHAFAFFAIAVVSALGARFASASAREPRA